MKILLMVFMLTSNGSGVHEAVGQIFSWDRCQDIAEEMTSELLNNTAVYYCEKREIGMWLGDSK